MNPNEPCRCRFRYVRFSHPPFHLCGLPCPNPDHGADELAHFTAMASNEPVQLRLF